MWAFLISTLANFILFQIFILAQCAALVWAVNKHQDQIKPLVGKMMAQIFLSGRKDPSPSPSPPIGGEGTEVTQHPDHIELNYRHNNNNYTLLLPYQRNWTDTQIHLKLADGGYRQINHPPGVPVMIPARQLGGIGYQVFIDDEIIEVDAGSVPMNVVGRREVVPLSLPSSKEEKKEN
jgi:hypothetical protein